MSHDTLPEARDIRIEALASSTPEERLREALELSDFVRDLARLGREHRASREHPDAPTADPHTR